MTIQVFTKSHLMVSKTFLILREDPIYDYSVGILAKTAWNGTNFFKFLRRIKMLE